MVDAFLGRLRNDPEMRSRIAAWHVEPRAEGSFAPFPAATHPELREVLRLRGIERLYQHQAEAARAVLEGRHAVIATPTASGKSLCYNLPILSRLLAAGEAASGSGGDRPTALYLFPTKALSQDQVAEVLELQARLRSLRQAGLASESPDPVAVHTYDGDTPGDARRLLRERGDIIVTNPHMLHVAILPNHMKWSGFFRRLRYVVIDELHVYRGIFGSAVANVLRRLKRVARHYGSTPTFVACSATIRDPAGHFERLVEEAPLVIDRNGAPRGERHHVFLNPPIVNPSLGLRARAVDEVRTIGRRLLAARVPSIVFGRSRTAVEILTKYLKDAAIELGIAPERVVGYRGGYLPELRREIERGLRAGNIDLVAATNALELGVDIGSLDAVVMTGYPGSVASYHQQSGRAGRRSGTSVSILVASSRPLDQFVVADPEFVLERGGESLVVNPDNLVIATNQLKCAAFELPFRRGDAFGRFPETGGVLELLSGEGGVLLAKGERYHWMDESFPAEAVSLDAVEMDNFLVLDLDADERGARSLGHVDRVAAMTTLHPQAIYQHQGVQYQIMELDWEGRRAYAKRVKVDYYTEADTQTEIQVLQVDGRSANRSAECGHGDVHVTHLATFWKRIRFYTNENLETGPIDLPPEEMTTTAFWVALEPGLCEAVRLKEAARAGAVHGLAALLKGVVPIHLRHGGGDLRARGFGSHPHFERPVVMLYDAVPGGVGLAEQLFRRRMPVFESALRAVSRCPCRFGCPSCIGLDGERGLDAKIAVRAILQALVRVGDEDADRDNPGRFLAFQGGGKDFSECRRDGVEIAP